MVISAKYKDSITNSDISMFLSNVGSSLENFRYFNSRKIDVLNNHLHTLLFYDDAHPVGYGHLDKDNENIWLGICVIEDYKRKGIGKMIMSDLLNYAEKIKLTVDKTNIAAVEMYMKYGFSQVKQDKAEIILMELNF